MPSVSPPPPDPPSDNPFDALLEADRWRPVPTNLRSIIRRLDQNIASIAGSLEKLVALAEHAPRPVAGAITPSEAVP